MSDIEIGDVTNGGEDIVTLGVFDHLMTAVEARLDRQFTQGRITGAQYAEVYLGSLQTVMAQAVQFVLQEQVADKQADLLTEQILTAEQTTAKVAAEKDLLTQKKFTEEAQTIDTVDGATVLGVVGKQKDLYGAQEAGFARDAEQKILKILLDTWNTGKVSDEAWPTPTGIENTSLDTVITKAKAGIDVT